MKYVLRAWGQLKRGFEVLALGEMCFEGMWAVAKGVWGVGTSWYGQIIWPQMLGLGSW